MIFSLEEQVCSIELSEKLKNLLVKQESIFYWADGSIVSSIDLEILLENNKIRSFSHGEYNWPDEEVLELYSAFTVPELLYLLPLGNGNYLELIKGCAIHDMQMRYCCRSHFDDPNNEKFVDVNPANSCAKHLIYLVENDLVSSPWKEKFLEK